MECVMAFRIKTRGLGREVFVWWGRLDLNQRPIGYEPTALTTELRPHWKYYTMEVGRFVIMEAWAKCGR